MKKSQLFLPFAAAISSPTQATTLFQWDPIPYFSEADSPFYEGIQNGTIYLEDFEDQALNTPNVYLPDNLPYIGQTFRIADPDASVGSVWSVDSDDGVLDGNGFLGDTWVGVNRAGFTLSSRMQFNFLPDEDGLYPRYVGIVVTGADDVDRDVSMALFDPSGGLIDLEAEYNPQDWNPPGGAIGGDPRTHRFIGFYNEDGIETLAMGNVFQVDHLQYGTALPEPTTGIFLLAGMGLAMRRRRCSLGN